MTNTNRVLGLHKKSYSQTHFLGKKGLAEITNAYLVTQKTSRISRYASEQIISYHVQKDDAMAKLASLSNEYISKLRELPTIRFEDEMYFAYKVFPERTPGGDWLWPKNKNRSAIFAANSDDSLKEIFLNNLYGKNETAEVVVIYGATHPCNLTEGKHSGFVIESYHLTLNSAKKATEGIGVMGSDGSVTALQAILFSGVYFLLSKNLLYSPFVLVPII